MATPTLTKTVTGTTKVQSERRRLLTVLADLKTERSSFDAHWQDIANHFRPRRGRFTVTETNRGDKRRTKIIDNTGSLASRTLASGMMSGITSPARPWFKLSTANPELNENANVKRWLDDVTRDLRTVLLKSNFYKIVPMTYGDIGDFATAAMSMEEDFENVVHFDSFPLGTFYISHDVKGNLQVFAREFRMKVRQLIDKFGRAKGPKEEDIDWSKFSRSVRDLYENDNREKWVEVCHMILPNDKIRSVETRIKVQKDFVDLFRGRTRGQQSNPGN